MNTQKWPLNPTKHLQKIEVQKNGFNASPVSGNIWEQISVVVVFSVNEVLQLQNDVGWQKKIIKKHLDNPPLDLVYVDPWGSNSL